MAKADLHVHSRYSDRPSEWFLQKLGASQSYTEPETIYQMAKERGMDFVTITDHNCMDGAIQLAERYDDAFTGVESTTYFPEDGCKIHLLIWGLTGEQFEEIQRIRENIYTLRDYLVDQKLAHSVAHPTYSINHKLSISHLEKLVLLFDVFEAISGGQARSSNTTLYYFLKYLNDEAMQKLQQRHGIDYQRSNSWVKGFTGGSDDHAGIYVGRTYTLAGATNPKEFLTHVNSRKAFAKGRSNDFQSLAFTVYKIAHDYSKQRSQPLLNTFSLNAINSIIFGERKANLLDSLTVMGLKADPSQPYKRKIAELVEDIRKSKIQSIEENLDKLYDTVTEIADNMVGGFLANVQEQVDQGDVFALMNKLSSALPGMFLAVPFFSSLHHLNNNRKLLADLRAQLPEKPNRRILWFTDTLNDLNGVSVTLKHLGWQFFASGIDIKIVTSLSKDEVTGALPPNMINLPSVTEFQLPYYESQRMKIPSILKALKQLNDYEPDEIFISTPGPVGILGAIAAKLFNIPMIGVYHTDFTLELSHIAENEDDSDIVETVESAVNWFYSFMDEIKVPTQEYIDIMAKRGLDPAKMRVFPRQIDHDRFCYIPQEALGEHKLDLPPGINLVFAGRVSRDKNLPFLIDVLREVWQTREDVNLIVLGVGPYLDEMKRELGNDPRVVFTGKLPWDHMPFYYSQGHAFVFPSVTDTFGMVVLESQCSELPALVSDRGGPKELVDHGETGFILPALEKEPWVNAILNLISMVENQPEQYEEMRHLSRVRGMANSGWEAVLKQLSSEELKPRLEPFVD